MWIGAEELDADACDGFCRRMEGEAPVEVASSSSCPGLARGVLAAATGMSSPSDAFAALWNAGAVMIEFVYFACAQCL